MDRNPFTRSEFEEHQNWEQQEHSRRDDHHSDGNKRKQMHISLGNLNMIQSIQQRNRQKIEEKGIGYSSERKPDPYRETEETNPST